MHPESTSEESHWTPEEQTFIARIMHAERAPRLEAIRRMRKRAGLALVRPTRTRRPSAKPTARFAAFADCRRLRIVADDCGDAIIPGRFGHLYEHGGDRFGVVLEEPADRLSRARAFLGRRRKAMAAGFTLHQAGDAEAILLFDPENREHVRLAIRLIGAKAKRRASTSQLEALRISRESRQVRSNPCAEGLPAS